MKLVLLTALGVGGATIFGAIIGFLFKKISQKFSDIVLSFAAGVMLAAAVLGLIIPSVEYGGKFGILVTVAGIFTGAVCLNLIDRLVPHLHKLVGSDIETHKRKLSIMKFKQIKFIFNTIFHIYSPFPYFINYIISKICSDCNMF